MNKNKVLNKNATLWFLMFAFMKVYQEHFLRNFFIIVKIGYENGLLLRYGLLIFLLLIYSLVPYLMVFGSYFIFKRLLYNQEIAIHLHIHIENSFFVSYHLFLLIHSIFCILMFLLLGHFFTKINRLIVAMLSIFATLTPLLFFKLLLLNKEFIDISIYSVHDHFALSILLLLISLFICLSFNKIKVLQSINFIIIYIIIAFSCPFEQSSFLKRVKKDFLGNFPLTLLLIFLFLIIRISPLSNLLLYHFHLVNFDQVIDLFVDIYILNIAILLILNFALIVAVLAVGNLEQAIATIISTVLFLIYEYPIDNYPLIFVPVINLIKIFIYRASVVIEIIALLLTIYYLPSIVLIHLFPNWWFSRKYRQLYGQKIHQIFKNFITESQPEGRKFILQSTLTSPSPLTQKVEMLTKMINHEQKGKKISQEVLDEIYKICQTLRQEQRQEELMGDVSPIAQNSQITSFEFTDPADENEHIIDILRLNSARQQLLGWLKGETPANPTIDKLLVYQWQDYEIGIGLKYSGQMGGDFYDIFQINENKFGLLVGDLTGHGVETALNLSKTHNFWAETDLSQDVLTTMRAFEQNFKTTFHPFPKYEGCELCYLQLKDNIITLSNSGLHLGMIQNKQWHFIANSPAENFGGFKKARCNPVKRHTRVALQPGDMLVVYTDGLFGNVNPNDERFGEAQLQQLFLAHQHANLKTLIETVFETVYQHCQPKPIEDDETLLVIRRISSTAD